MSWRFYPKRHQNKIRKFEMRKRLMAWDRLTSIHTLSHSKSFLSFALFTLFYSKRRRFFFLWYLFAYLKGDLNQLYMRSWSIEDDHNQKNNFYDAHVNQNPLKDIFEETRNNKMISRKNFNLFYWQFVGRSHH